MPTQVFLLQGTTSFPDPGNWNPSANMVECIGCGYQGGGAWIAPGRTDNLEEPQPLVARAAGGGGGGGGYGYDVNLNPTFPVTVNVPAASAGSSAQLSAYWNNYSSTPGNVYGGNGQGSVQTNGGPGGAFYPKGFNGGTGGLGNTTLGWQGSGGGGAAGPHGAGGAGTSASGTPAAAGAGGSADGGTVAGGAVGAANANSGPRWDLSHGCGSGGGGGQTSSGPGGAFAGGNGGSYGGGGGGMGGDTTAPTFGLGSPGLIVITYLPLGTTQVFIVSPFVGSFPDPGNWNPSNNMVECVGAGGFGGLASVKPALGGGGGGGGAYAYGTNQNVPFPVPFVIPGPDAFFVSWGTDNSGQPITSGPGVSAGCGGSGLTGASGGVAGTQFYPNGHAGGNGGQVSGSQGGGGGGAGGPHGVGGGPASNTTIIATGGSGDGGVTPGQTVIGGNGYSGVQFNPWASTPNGIGGGGAGAVTSGANGGNGGSYGGGGGGAAYGSGNGGSNGPGIIVLTYVPLPPPAGQAQILA